VSVTTFGDLLTQAEQVLIALAGQRGPDPLGLAAAWLDFSRRAVHAITAAAGARDPRWYAVDRLIVEVARAAGRASRGPAVSPLPMDPLLERAGVLLGAAGDVLASAPRDFGADPMLADANVQAAQSRVAALLAAAAHTGVRALGRYDGSATLTREASRDLATSLMKVEQLATAVFQSSPTIAGRADDVAVVSVQPGRLPLEDAIEVWGRQARDTVRCPSPSARDLQAVAADLSRVATHSRVIVRTAVAYKLVDPDRGRAAEQSLARVAAGWLDVAQAWSRFHTAQPPTPSKIAASHSLGQALMATTRHDRDWAQPNMVAERIDVSRALAALRRAQDVGADVAEAQPQIATRLADSGLLYAPAASTAPSLERLRARIRGELVTVDRTDITALSSTMNSQQSPPPTAADRLPGASRPNARQPTAMGDSAASGSTKRWKATRPHADGVRVTAPR